MWNWYSSTAPRNAERHPFAVTVGVILIAAVVGSAPAEAMRQVVVEFRIAPNSTFDQPRFRAPEVITQVESELARAMQEKFQYLEWIVSSPTVAADSPRWTLRLDDGPAGACDPPAVRATFQARGTDGGGWEYAGIEFTAICDIAAPETTVVQLVTRVGEILATVFRDVTKMDELARQFLSRIAVARALSPDAAARKLYLPLKGLGANRDSEIEVRFADQLNQILVAHPAETEGDRTLLLVERGRCGALISFALGADMLPDYWHPQLQAFLDACSGEPWVYMTRYVSSGVEVNRGVVTALDEGGQP